MRPLKALLFAGEPRAEEAGPFVIAEMSGNHGGALERALAIVDAAADAGAHALKLQTFTPDSMTLDLDADDFRVTKRGSPWCGRKLYDLYVEAQTPRAWHVAIFDRARAKGLLCFSSAFDEAAVDFLESLGAPAYKIASFELVDLPLIRRAAATGKPLILSTGMATLGEIEDAVEAARTAGATHVTLLACTSSYPAPIEASNLRRIPALKAAFGCEAGLSDHTLGIGAAVAATALGATVIEKHITLSRAEETVDAAFSLEPCEFAALVEETRRAALALGAARFGADAAEAAARDKRRSLYVARDMAEGEPFTAENLRRIRPGRGLAPKYYDAALGRPARRAIARGTPLSWDMIG